MTVYKPDFNKTPNAGAGGIHSGMAEFFRKRKDSRTTHIHARCKYSGQRSCVEVSPHQVRFLREWFQWREAELVKAGLLEVEE